MGLLASGQLSLDKGAEEPFPGCTWPHTAVREASLVGAWLGVDKGGKPCSSSLASPRPYSQPSGDPGAGGGTRLVRTHSGCPPATHWVLYL